MTLRTEDVHIKQLRQFIYDPNIVVPRDIALNEMNMRDIETIRSHKGNLNGPKTQLFFEVHWANTPASEDSFEPWHGVFRTEAMHTYLTSIGRAGMIPPAYRPEI